MENLYLVGSGKFGLTEEHDCHVYLIDGGEEKALVDSGAGLDVDGIVANIVKEGFRIEDINYILLTHCHADHAGGSKELREKTGAQIIIPAQEDRLLAEGTDEELGLQEAKFSGRYPKDYVFQHCKPDRVINDGEEIKVGQYVIKAIQVPGHSVGSVCYLTEIEGKRVLFTGDVVFYNGIIGLLNCYGSSLSDYRIGIKKLAGLHIDALLPGSFSFTLRNGQKHIDQAIENLKKVAVPPSTGQFPMR